MQMMMLSILQNWSIKLFLLLQSHFFLLRRAEPISYAFCVLTKASPPVVPTHPPRACVQRPRVAMHQTRLTIKSIPLLPSNLGTSAFLHVGTYALLQ